MGFDDSSTAFVASSTSHSTGSPTNMLGKALDATATGGAAASPYVVSHVATLTTAEFNTFTVKRIALHNLATAPVVGSTTIAFGIDSLSLMKTSGFSLISTLKLSYT